jgi:hypothetical protein
MGLLAGPLFGGSAEDDLAVVKKAVGPEARPAPRAETRAEAPEARKDEPRWLKLRITDRGDKKGKVSINLPLDLVRALDEDDHVGRLLSSPTVNGKGASMRLGDVLRALRSGQEIVEIEDEEATVRIWVE